jgi:hypothetical protein
MINITFQISTGYITDDAGNLLSSVAYAGNDSRTPQNPDHIQGKNNPEMTGIEFIGPLPVGVYNVGPFGNYPVVGVNAAKLSQMSGESYGRGDFYIHGQENPNSINFGQESEGCLVVPHSDRLIIAALIPTQLTVIA